MRDKVEQLHADIEASVAALIGGDEYPNAGWPWRPASRSTNWCPGDIQVP